MTISLQSFVLKMATEGKKIPHSVCLSEEKVCMYLRLLSGLLYFFFEQVVISATRPSCERCY